MAEYLFTWTPADVLPDAIDPEPPEVHLYGPGARGDLIAVGNRLQAEAEAAGEPIPGYVVRRAERPPA